MPQLYTCIVLSDSVQYSTWTVNGRGVFIVYGVYATLQSKVNKLRLKLCQAQVQFKLESDLVGLRFVKVCLNNR